MLGKTEDCISLRVWMEETWSALLGARAGLRVTAFLAASLDTGGSTERDGVSRMGEKGVCFHGGFWRGIGTPT